MLVRKAFKYRFYPNKEQQAALAVQFGQARFINNHFLHKRQEHYQATGEGQCYQDTTKLLRELKHRTDTDWLREADSQVLQQSLKDLDRAYQNFFTGRSGYPRFKSRRAKQAVRYPQRVKVNSEAKRVYLPKVGWVKTVIHRPLEGKVKNVTVTKTKSGRYYAAFQVEVEIEEPISQGEMVGVDLGLKRFAVLSDGHEIANPGNLMQAEVRMRRMQRKRSRKEKGSRGWEKQRQKVARQHEKVANRRSDFQHKLSRTMVVEYGRLALEDLNIKGMVRNQKLAKHICDAGWGQFVRMLAYKGNWYGCQVERIDRWYPSSKTCSVCGTERERMPLEIRARQCPMCGSSHDRDQNAAINILMQTTVGTTGRNAGPERDALEQGVHVRPDSIRLGR
jgi:putative transposase